MGDDDTQSFAPVARHPAAKQLAGTRTPPRLYGWPLAFTIVGVAFFLAMTLIVGLAVAFADRLPQP